MSFFETPGRLAREGLSSLVVGRVPSSAEIFGCSFDVQRRPVSLWLFSRNLRSETEIFGSFDRARLLRVIDDNIGSIEAAFNEEICA